MKEGYQLTQKVIEKGRKCWGGFIQATGCDTPPEASDLSLRAIMQTVSDFGWYE
jgi:uroporphyrinogen-III decarboxylase